MKVYWDEQDRDALVVEPAERMQRTLDAVAVLRTAETFGEVRDANLPDWARGLAEQVVQHHEEDFGDGVTGDTPWDTSDIVESIIDAAPLPWDAESVCTWLDRDLLARHATISGASPGGNVDGYRVADRDAFLRDLEAAGHTLEHRPGLVQEFYQAL